MTHTHTHDIIQVDSLSTCLCSELSSNDMVIIPLLFADCSILIAAMIDLRFIYE